MMRDHSTAAIRILRWLAIVAFLFSVSPAPADEPSGAELDDLDEIFGLFEEGEQPVEPEDEGEPAPEGAQPRGAAGGQPPPDASGAGEAQDFDPEFQAETDGPRMTEGIEEIVVKGARQKQSLQDVPVSITQFTASDIKDLRIQNISDLADYTPNLEINTAFAASNATLFIRGIGLKDYNANAAGAVAVYQDNIYINSSAANLFQLFDVEDVRVERGPQGSVDARNATAGAIIVTNTRPDGEFSAGGTMSYGNFNLVEAQSHIGFPIVDQTLSGRLAMVVNYQDPWRTNGCAGLAPRDPQPSVVPNPSPPPNEFCLDCAPVLPCQAWQPQDGRFWPMDSQFAGLRGEVNNAKDWASRGVFLFQPTDGWEFLLNMHGGQNRSHARHWQMCGTTGKSGSNQERREAKLNCTAFNQLGFSEAELGDGTPLEGFPQNPDIGWYDQTGREKLDVWGFSLISDWDVGPVDMLGPTRITTTTGYEWNSRYVEDDGDACPCRLTPSDFKDGAWQVSNEIRAVGGGDNYTWTMGSYFLHEKVEAHNLLFGAGNIQWEQRFDQTLYHFAPYASFRFDLSEKWNIRGGLRYNWEYKEFALGTVIFIAPSGSPPTPDNLVASLRESDGVSDIWTGFTGDFTVSFLPIEQLTTYVKYVRGMKSGHFNAGATVDGQSIDPVNPEFIHSVELGAKGTFFDGLLTVSGALFRYWYKDLQVFDIVNESGTFPLSQLLNAPQANVLGAEGEIDVTPVPNLRVNLRIGWLDSEFEDFSVRKRVRRGSPRGNSGGLFQTFDYSGEPLISAPELSFTGLVEYDLALPREWGTVIPRFDWSYKDETSLALIDFDSANSNFPQPINTLVQAPFWLFNASLSYRSPDERFEITGWVKNMLNERYLVDAFDLSIDSEFVQQVWNEPRSYGMTLSYYFD